MAYDRVTDAMVLAAIDGFNEAAADGELFLTSLRDQARMRNALLDALRAEAGAVGWMPIETAPNDGTPIIGYGTVCGMTGAFQTAWSAYGDGSIAKVKFLAGEGPEGTFWYTESNWTQGWNPTHWMPLPPRPSQKD